MYNRCFAVSLFVMATLIPSAHAGSSDSAARVRHQLVAWYTRSAPAATTIQQYMRRLRPDGSWPDINYASKERGAWPPYRHVSRALAMAQAYRAPDHPLAGKPELRAAVLRALAHWTENSYECPNWWYMRIGVPSAVAPTLILMGDAVPEELRERTIRRVLDRSEMGMTGQNKVWCAGIGFMKGLLADDESLMREARDQIFSELRITTAEGVQPDYSFHQHGPQQQWGNYGSSFGSDTIKWAVIFRDTDYAVEPQRLTVLRGYLQEGAPWILWKRRMDISGCGRQVFRNCQSSKGSSILRQLELMTRVDPAQADVYRRLIAANSGEPELAGHKHYWRSDISVHRRPTWYASVKMSSIRVIGAETCNSENMLGLHLGDGVTYFYRTGREYENIFPVWDWSRLPGTTCRQHDGSLVPESKRCRGSSDFVGGVSDGRRGLAAMEYARDGLSARKAWFFLEDAVVCTGAGIGCNQPEPVVTTVNQCLLNGPVILSAEQHKRTLTKGEHRSDKVEWVRHDGMGYVFLEPASITAGADEQQGNWHRVHHRESKKTVRRDVFSLGIDHGVRPQGAQYAYAVFPDITAEALQSLHASSPFRILQQTASLQAISTDDGDCVQAAFFEPGRLIAEKDLAVEVDAPCLVMLRQSARSIHLHVADPTHRRETIHVTVSGEYAATGATYDPSSGRTRLAMAMPQGGRAGQAVSVRAAAPSPNQKPKSK